MNCAHPIDFTVFSDYCIGALPAVEEAAVEEHLFTCPACSARLEQSIAIAEGVRTEAAQGKPRQYATSVRESSSNRRAGAPNVGQR